MKGKMRGDNDCSNNQWCWLASDTWRQQDKMKKNTKLNLLQVHNYVKVENNASNFIYLFTLIPMMPSLFGNNTRWIGCYFWCVLAVFGIIAHWAHCSKALVKVNWWTRLLVYFEPEQLSKKQMFMENAHAD